MNRSQAKLLWTTLAVAATALAYAFGFALEPLPWLPLLMWVAPLPMLLMAPRLRARTTFLAAAVAWSLGGVRLWWYFWDTIELPVALVAASALLTACGFAGCVLLFRALILRGRLVLAVTAVPAAWVCLEFGMSLVNAEAAGNWWSLAYTQADFAPVLRTVSVAGTAGISFLLLAVPCAVAIVVDPRTAVRQRTWIGGGMAVAMAVTLGFGLVRPAPGGETVRAAALALPPPAISLPSDDREARTLADDYRAQLTRLRAEGVSVAVLPENVFDVAHDDRERFLGRWRKTARETGVNIVLGIALHEADVKYNVAAWIPADDSPTVLYRKNHLIPGLEDTFTPSHDTTVIPGGNGRAMAICKDFDYADLTDRYRDAGATIMFAPALDFHVDGWWHSRVAITRGAEQGMALVRTGLQGRMTISDPYGRILDDDRKLATAEVSTTGASTIYSKLGDWLVWLSIAITVLSLVFALRRRTSAN